MQCPRHAQPISPCVPVKQGARVLGVVFVFVTMLCACTPGCTSSESAKTSLFEEDHVNPPHWPTGLSDVAVKLRERVSAMEHSAKPETAKEIEDLVSWVGEIAADTDLSESDWDPLYNLSEAVIVNLRMSPGKLADADRAAIEKLCVLIDETVLKIPERPHFGEDHP